jgi:TolA-binding protein
MKIVPKAKITALTFSFFLGTSSMFALAPSTEHGYESFRQKDWQSAAIFLRQSVNMPSERTSELVYMLIVSEINAKNYKNVLLDCDLFLSLYPKSVYRAPVMYQKAKCAYLRGEYDNALLFFSDFCNSNVGHELYSQALFWIGESFFAMYDFDSAKEFYERIVLSFPDSPKKEEAQRRLEDISHYEREDKLLYLLKVTGEEYLAAKEDYERELKIYKNSDIDGLRQRIREYSAQIAELEAKIASIQAENESAKAELKNRPVVSPTSTVQQSAVLPPTGAISVPVKGGAKTEEPKAEEQKATQTPPRPVIEQPKKQVEKKSATGIMTESELEALKAKALRIQEMLKNSESETATEAENSSDKNENDGK